MSRTRTEYRPARGKNRGLAKKKMEAWRKKMEGCRREDPYFCTKLLNSLLVFVAGLQNILGGGRPEKGAGGRGGVFHAIFVSADLRVFHAIAASADLLRLAIGTFVDLFCTVIGIFFDLLRSAIGTFLVLRGFVFMCHRD